jgi:hypothetical protein
MVLIRYQDNIEHRKQQKKQCHQDNKVDIKYQRKQYLHLIAKF